MYGYRNDAVLDLLVTEPKKYLADELGNEAIENLPAELLRSLAEDLLSPAELIDKEYFPWAAQFITEAGKSFEAMEPELRLGLLNGKRSMVPSIKGSRTAAELIVAFSLGMKEKRANADPNNRARLEMATTTTRSARSPVNKVLAEKTEVIQDLVEDSIQREWFKSEDHYTGVLRVLTYPFHEAFRILLLAPLIGVSPYPVQNYWWDSLDPAHKARRRFAIIMAKQS